MSRQWRWTTLSAARDFGEEAEETALAVTAEAPVHRHTLVAFVEGFTLLAKIEVTPRCSFTDRGNEVVLRLVEVEMIILIEEDRFGRISGNPAGLPHHFADTLRFTHAIAVKQEIVRGADDILPRDGV